MYSKSYNLVINKKISSFKKNIKVDSDKSISIRSFIISSISQNVSIIKNVLESEDVFSTIQCLRKLGVRIIKKSKGNYLVYGKGLGSLYAKKNTELNFGNSGTLARLLIGVLSSTPNIEIKVKGDHSLNKRDMKKLIFLMSKFGATFLPKNKFKLPITLISSAAPIGFKFHNGISSQIKSAVILGAINSFGKTQIIEKIKSRDHTEKILKHNNKTISVKKGKNNLIEINGRESLKPFKLSVPGDPSSASFFAALCLLNKNSNIILKKVHINPTRIGFFNIIKKHKGKIFFKNKKLIGNEIVADIHVKSSNIKPLKISKKFFVSCQDEFPLMFAISCLLPGTSVFRGIEDLANKESNRIKEMGKILKQIGIKFIASKDEMRIYGNPYLKIKNKKINVSGIFDHRILMSAAILSLLTGINSKLRNFEQVGTSCPNFLSTIFKLGGRFEREN